MISARKANQGDCNHLSGKLHQALTKQFTAVSTEQVEDVFKRLINDILHDKQMQLLAVSDVQLDAFVVISGIYLKLVKRQTRRRAE